MATVTVPLLYDAMGSRRVDQAAIAGGVTGYALMCRAARAACELLLESWPNARQVQLLAGPGNNGGDAYVLARLLKASGMQVELLTVGDHHCLIGDARQAAEDAQAAHVHIREFQVAEALQGDVLVDGLLGTGFHGKLKAPYRQAIVALNVASRPILALDLPSGVEADTGRAVAAVMATKTLSFITRKRGLYTGPGQMAAGEVHFADLGVSDDYPAETVRLLDLSMKSLLMPRPKSAHKGHYGHVLVVGGEQGFGGACLMAAEAAARVGAGLVSVASRASTIAALLVRRPELMGHAVDEACDLTPLLAKATVVVVGPGLGQSAWARTLFLRILESDLHLVVDADALNLLTASPRFSDKWVLTPHPGEASRLLGVETMAVQENRFAAVEMLRARYGGVVVLKGSGSLIASAESVALCPFGNPGMATGGMGDVLSGVIAGLMAQGLGLDQAAALGVLIHARAGDEAARDGERGLLATDLLLKLRAEVNP